MELRQSKINVRYGKRGEGAGGNERRTQVESDLFKLVEDAMFAHVAANLALDRVEEAVSARQLQSESHALA